MPTDILGRPVLTAAQLEDMTPEQRTAAFDASIVTDLTVLPAGYLARLRAGAEERLRRRGPVQEVPRLLGPARSSGL